MKAFVILAILISLFFTSTFCQNKPSAQENIYKDGIYSGKSQSHYNKESYVGFVEISFIKNEITAVKFEIWDTLKNEQFLSNYKKHYPNNKAYQQQSRDNWEGVLFYSTSIKKVEDIQHVDVITGATWAHDLFVDSFKEALKSNPKPIEK